MTITCPKCGKSVSSDYQFCPYCGGSLAGNGNFNTGNTGNSGSQGGTRGGNILGGNAMGCLGLVASFIIPLIGIVLYFVYRRKNNMQAARKVLIAALAGLAFNLLINFVGHGSQYSYFHNLMG